VTGFATLASPVPSVERVPISFRELSTKILRLQRRRDNIVYVLMHEELSHDHTLQLETQLSAVEDELIFLLMDEAA
jgi:hypothetical protein